MKKREVLHRQHVALLYRIAAFINDQPISHVFNEDEATLKITCRYLRTSESVGVQIISNCHKRRDILGKVGDLAIGFCRLLPVVRPAFVVHPSTTVRWMNRH